MDKYIARGTVTLSTGNVQLTKRQAERRNMNLKNVGDGIFYICAPIQFKAGESFGYEGPIPKNMMMAVDPISGSDYSPAQSIIKKRNRRKS